MINNEKEVAKRIKSATECVNNFIKEAINDSNKPSFKDHGDVEYTLRVHEHITYEMSNMRVLSNGGRYSSIKIPNEILPEIMEVIKKHQTRVQQENTNGVIWTKK